MPLSLPMRSTAESNNDSRALFLRACSVLFRLWFFKFFFFIVLFNNIAIYDISVNLISELSLLRLFLAGNCPPFSSNSYFDAFISSPKAFSFKSLHLSEVAFPLLSRNKMNLSFSLRRLERVSYNLSCQDN